MEANATDISVTIRTQPEFSFEVRDNGCGISFADMKQVGDSRYLTSKSNAKGESLHSIIKTCNTCIISKRANFPKAFKKVFEDSVSSTVRAFPTWNYGDSGTVISCSNLFFHFPVRKKMLAQTLSQSLNDVVEFIKQTSLVSLDKSFCLVVDDGLIANVKTSTLALSNPGQALLDRFEQYHGRGENAVVISRREFDGVFVSGFSATSQSRCVQYAFVNNKSLDVEKFTKKDEFCFDYVLVAECPTQDWSTIYQALRNALFFCKMGPISVPITSEQLFKLENEEKEFKPTSLSLFNKLYGNASRQPSLIQTKKGIHELMEHAIQQRGLPMKKNRSPSLSNGVRLEKLKYERNEISSFKFNKEHLARLSVIRQIANKFIIALLKDQNNILIVAIDQHAADERIRLENFENAILDIVHKKPGPKVCPVQYSQTISMSSENGNLQNLLTTFQRKLEDWFWRFEIITKEHNKASLHVKTVPCLFIENETVTLNHEDMMSFLSELEYDSSSWIPKRIHEIMNSKACRGAIMFGDALSNEQCRELIQKLSQCTLPFQCAHGRPSK
ncbi:hypothetical protein C9374_012638 [Naegleria lovaniensis]|uniref:MutL C-terminal dimerisation domain-containing protein n=1 Tax=Naegleria lovaniensis TaxID=51637 RepID=A0AA88H1J9_NAELO|nr:uncharacterized protein C9374_012638 [Naegleria lovaniensis]KAG2392386.1 hypothetical protein C9374_012638 [Naegleria lovaniensis]